MRHKPRKPIPKENKKTKQKRIQTTKEWFDKNPPDVYGRWTCYLQISPDCYRKVNKHTINLEHTKSKVRHPELKYDVDKIKPACPPCNKMKGSRDDTDLDLLKL